MRSFQKLKSCLTKLLLDHRWLILLFLGALALLFEVIEHWGEENPVDAHFVREVFFFGVIYPIAVGMLLNLLLQVQNERNTIIHQKAWEKRLQQELRMAANWDELVRVIVHFPQIIAPVAGITLLHHSLENNELNQVAELWLEDVPGEYKGETAVSPSLCGIMDHIPGQGLHPFTSPVSRTPILHGYCLPLWNNNRFIGLLHLYFLPAEQLNSEQINLFNYLASTTAQAVETATLDNPEFLHAAAARHERKRVARHLHDTLAQNLSYLRLKLDQLTVDDTLRHNKIIYQDLERMHDIANEAYAQVRHTIMALQPDNPHNLAEDLLILAQQTAKQANFALRHQVQGTAVLLPPLTQHKILSIFREVLDNVQCHAQARHIDLSIIWTTDQLTIDLADDGLGFDPDKPVEYGRFGLLIMQRRAAEIQGQLSIQAEAKQGTRITLQYPLGESS